jgi:threonine/homoserine/homoserine lactone efflux protein
MEIGLGLFLLSAAAISFTGVMLPGPMTAATIAKGYGDKNAGAWIAVGHAVIEIPLIAAIYLGFGHFIGFSWVVNIIYVVGGLALFYLGFRMFRTAGNAVGEIGGLPTSSLVTGIVITGTNPAFYVWWVTVGMALIVGAAKFGFTGILLFTLVHWPCDLAWSEFLSMGTFKSRKWWTQKVQRVVFTVCALILIGFGVWFCLSAFL